jgi:hypothetical protein
MLGLLFDPEDGGSMYLRNFSGILPHSVIPQKIVIIVTAMRTVNLTN